MSDSDKKPETIDITEVEPMTSTVLSIEDRKVTVSAKDADEAMAYIDQLSDNDSIPAKEEKRLVTKIDFAILPVIIALMAFSLLDKTINGYAAVFSGQSLRTDLHMTGNEYSWVGSSFYLGYLVFQFPANYLLQHYPISKVLSAAVILWGIILMCHAACQNSASFLTCRVLLGVFEGFMNPACIMLTSQWWRKEEQFMRSCIWWGFQGFGTIFGAGVAYGLALHRPGYHAFATWKLLYVIIGILTVVFGLIALVHLPDSPSNAWFLNDTEKRYCLIRAHSNQQGYGNRKFKMHQFKEALLDPVGYLFFLYGMSYAVPNGGFTNFGTILLHGDFGFDSLHAMLMSMPGGGIDVVAPFTVAYFNYKVMGNRRLPTCIMVNSITVIGMCLLNFTHNKGSRLAGYLSFYIATAVSAGAASILASNVAGYTKKSTFNVMYLVGYCVGNVVGPQTFKSGEAPGYVSAKVAMLVSFVGGTIVLALMLCIYIRRNSLKDKERAELGDKYIVSNAIAFADLTDKENPEFRYSL